MVSFTIYLLFVVSYFLHLTSRIPVLGTLRFDFILMAILFAYFLLALPDTTNRYLVSKVNKRLFLFICYFVLTIPLVKWPGSVIRHGIEWYSKVVFFYFFSVAFVTTEKRLKIFLISFLGCQIFRGLEPAYLHITEGYWGDVAYSHSGGEMYALDRLSGAPHDIVNPNQLAWVIVNTFPFLFYLGWHGNNLMKGLAIAISPILLYTLLLTGSRSGIVILASVFFGFAFFSENKRRSLIILGCIVLSAASIIAGLLRPELVERYFSLISDSAVGADSAAGRIQGLITALETIVSPYGLFGYGLGTSYELNYNIFGSGLVTHNLYLETIQEVGIVGFLIFSSYIVCAIRELLDVWKSEMKHCSHFLKQTNIALLVWVFMNLIYSLSCFGLSSWEWYLFGGIIVVTVQMIRDKEKPSDPLSEIKY